MGMLAASSASSPIRIRSRGDPCRLGATSERRVVRRAARQRRCVHDSRLSLRHALLRPALREIGAGVLAESHRAGGDCLERGVVLEDPKSGAVLIYERQPGSAVRKQSHDQVSTTRAPDLAVVRNHRECGWNDGSTRWVHVPQHAAVVEVPHREANSAINNSSGRVGPADTGARHTWSAGSAGLPAETRCPLRAHFAGRSWRSRGTCGADITRASGADGHGEPHRLENAATRTPCDQRALRGLRCAEDCSAPNVVDMVPVNREQHLLTYCKLAA